MFTVLKYENADTKYWRPDGTPSELENPLELNNATAFWKEMAVGLIAPSEPAISRQVHDGKRYIVRRARFESPACRLI
jgi:hypothetical protein